jgi:thiamine pyrophosphate-dependent acetolactate synthase large subunit-like protein
LVGSVVVSSVIDDDEKACAVVTSSTANSYLRFDQPASFFGAMSFGNCGYAFPAAMVKIGAGGKL